MKKTIAPAGLVLTLFALLSFSNSKTASINGEVAPSAYALNAWALSKADTLYTTITKGRFEFANVEPGVYRLIIGAESPYRYTVKDNLVVAPGENTDVGKLTLEKYVTVFK